MGRLRLHCVGRIDRVLHMLHTGYRSSGQVLALHDGRIQLKRSIGSHGSSNTRIEQGIALEIVDHRSHRLVTLATSRQDLITYHQS